MARLRAGKSTTNAVPEPFRQLLRDERRNQARAERAARTAETERANTVERPARPATPPLKRPGQRRSVTMTESPIRDVGPTSGPSSAAVDPPDGKRKRVDTPPRPRNDKGKDTPGSARPRSRVRVQSPSPVRPSSRAAGDSADPSVDDHNVSLNLDQEDDGDDGDYTNFDDFDDDDSDDDDDDLGDWETVTIPAAPSASAGDVEVIFSAAETASLAEARSRATRPRVSSREAREARMVLHKCHVASLIWHGAIRNGWINTSSLQRLLAETVPTKMTKFFSRRSDWTAPQEKQMFINGLGVVCEFWRARFRIVRPGLCSASGIVDPPEQSSGPVFDPRCRLDLDTASRLGRFGLIAAADQCRGSPDEAAQLFVALLRGLGLEARLVFSLQAIPLRKKANPSAPTASPTDSKNPTKTRIRLDKPTEPDGETEISRPKRPVFWAEVFSPPSGRWITVDPVCTGTVDRPIALEPTVGMSKTITLSYVIAFERDGHATDVTRRYSRAFNGRTRLLRLDSGSPSSDPEWLLSLLRAFQTRRRPLTREVDEQSGLAGRVAAEGLPASVMAFRYHPIYALDRHVRKNEVVHPRNPVGRFRIGNSTEHVFRRSDVHIVRSEDHWFRRGRDIIPSSGPLKIAIRKRRRIGRPPQIEPEEERVLLFAQFQTQLYIPPPVVDGLVPKNKFGNIDIYVPTMVPTGGTHISDPQASQAASLLGIDYADAITGFSFSSEKNAKPGSFGFTTTAAATKSGIVVATQFEPAVRAVISALVDLEADKRMEETNRQAVVRWIRWRDFMKIKERVNQYATEPSKCISGGFTRHQLESTCWDARRESKLKVIQDRWDRLENQVGDWRNRWARSLSEKRDKGGDPDGGFIPDDYDAGGGGFILDDNLGGGFIPDDNMGGGFIPDNDLGGGFIPDNDLGGGFIPDDHYVPPSSVPENTRPNHPSRPPSSPLTQLTSHPIRISKPNTSPLTRPSSPIQPRPAGSPLTATAMCQSPSSDHGSLLSEDPDCDIDTLWIPPSPSPISSPVHQHR